MLYAKQGAFLSCVAFRFFLVLLHFRGDFRGGVVAVQLYTAVNFASLFSKTGRKEACLNPAIGSGFQPSVQQICEKRGNTSQNPVF